MSDEPAAADDEVAWKADMTGVPSDKPQIVGYMPRVVRGILALGCIVLGMASASDWGGPWTGLLAFALGVTAVVLGLYDRDVQKVDDHTTLNIQR